jgi:hypothetical protein
MATGHLDAALSVVPNSQASGGGHLCQDEERPLPTIGERLINQDLLERLDDTLATEDADIDNISPLGDTQSTVVILLLGSSANIDELAVLENEEVVLFGKGKQTLNSFFSKVPDNIYMRLEDGDVGAEGWAERRVSMVVLAMMACGQRAGGKQRSCHTVCELEQAVRVGLVGRDDEVGLFGLGNLEQLANDRVFPAEGVGAGRLGGHGSNAVSVC